VEVKKFNIYRACSALTTIAAVMAAVGGAHKF
jgi:hypothetical protein